MSIGEITLKKHDERGMRFSIPYADGIDERRSGEIEAFVFDPSFKMPGRLPAVSLTWKGVLTSDLILQWLLDVDDLLPRNTGCLFRLWSSDDQVIDETFDLPASRTVDTWLRLAQTGAIVAFRPLSEAHDLYLWGHLSHLYATPRVIEDDQEVGVSLSSEDMTDVRIQRLVTALFAATIGGKLDLSEVSEDLFTRIQRASHELTRTRRATFAH